MTEVLVLCRVGEDGALVVDEQEGVVQFPTADLLAAQGSSRLALRVVRRLVALLARGYGDDIANAAVVLVKPDASSGELLSREAALQALGSISVDLFQPGRGPFTDAVFDTPDFDWLRKRDGEVIGYGEFAVMFGEALDRFAS